VRHKLFSVRIGTPVLTFTPPRLARERLHVDALSLACERRSPRRFARLGAEAVRSAALAVMQVASARQCAMRPRVRVGVGRRFPSWTVPRKFRVAAAMSSRAHRC
jgi:hypothetical protein